MVGILTRGGGKFTPPCFNATLDTPCTIGLKRDGDKYSIDQSKHFVYLILALIIILKRRYQSFLQFQSLIVCVLGRREINKQSYCKTDMLHNFLKIETSIIFEVETKCKVHLSDYRPVGLLTCRTIDLSDTFIYFFNRVQSILSTYSSKKILRYVVCQI